MSEYVFKVPDLGEGTVEAEIVAWHVKPGETVSEDKVLVEIMTDKAAVEVPSPVSGRIVSLRGEPGDRLPVGSPLIVFDTGTAAGTSPAVKDAPGGTPDAREAAHAAPPAQDRSRAAPTRVMASPATRRRAREAGIDLESIEGSGPGGRILKQDLPSASGAAHRGNAVPDASVKAAPGATTEIRIIGVRRVIAERMSEAKRTIPHFAYVEEVDVTELESLRQHLNAKAEGRAALTYLPFVVTALVRVLESFPQCNALYDAERGVLVQHASVHVGIATQTPDGLKVPVVRNAQSLGLWDVASQVRRLSERARNNQASRTELTGSTITITSLGKLGGIASTPVINAPEVAIIGLNKAVERPVVHQGAVAIRRIMNLSSSFDHRFVDGYDAAAMIQELKDLLEHPATLFIPKSSS